MKVTTIIYRLKRLLHPEDYVTERTRKKYEDVVYDLPIPPMFDETKSKYRGKNVTTNEA